MVCSYDTGMRVSQASPTTTSRFRRPQHSLYMEASFRSDTGNDISGESGAASGKMRDNNGSYSLVRHNSAVFEHDFDTNRSSLVHTVSEVREEMQLGLNHHVPRDGCNGNSNGKPGKNNVNLTAERQLVREFSHEFSHESYSSSPVDGKRGQMNSFVYKNYSSLHDRRTLSLPVGSKEYSINEYVGRSEERQSHLDTEKASRNVSYTQSHMSIVESSSCGGSSGDLSSCIHDFDMEVERHSKSTLFFQAGSTLLTVLIAILTLILCIRFLTSATSKVSVEQDTGSPYHNASSGPEDNNTGFSHCKLFAKACPILGLLTAGFAVITGAWVSDVRLWRRPHDTSTCTHCEDYEINRCRAEEADEKVQRAHRSKQQFMAYVFHNIRVPFNAIVLGLGHMRAVGDGANLSACLTADKMDLVQMMLDCAETMTSVLDDVTDMGQWEVGQMELHKDEFDILAVIKFLSWGLKDLLEQKDIAFNMNVDKVASDLLTSHYVIGDKQRVVQTLGNLLSNAVKFTPSGGKLDLELQCEDVVESKDMELLALNSSPPTPTCSSEGTFLGAAGIQILTKTTSQGKDCQGKVARLRLSVKDNGIGISAEDQAKLFEPYSFVTSGWVQKAGVSGLGLSMAKRFVERAGGSIGVESEEGSGSTFFFSIPFPLVPIDMENEREASKADSGAPVLQKSEVIQSMSSSGVTVMHESITLSRRRSSTGVKEDPKPAAKVQSTKKVDGTKESAAMRQRKVLLVEDTRINRIILRKVLQNLNLQCDEAENGQIAVDLHKQGKVYDLILMDKEMPVMDGHEATRQLRVMGVKTPIIALTGNALTTDRELFFEAGVDDFQTKPLSRDKLVQLLARYGVESSCAKRA